MKLLSYKKIILFICMAFLIASQIPLIKPFFHSGFFPTHDGVQTVRIFEYYQAIHYGQMPPRWAAGLLYGHGYPLFVFYGPFTYILGSLFVFLGFNFLLATKIVFILGFFIGVTGMFFLIRHFTGNISAIFASLIYSLLPYRAVDVYVRGALPEFLGLSLLPWILFVNIKLLQKPKNYLLKISFSLLFSILIITHNLSSFIFITFLLPFNLFYIFQYERKNIKEIVKAFFISGLLIFSTTCFYWLPLIIESSFVQLNKFSNYPYIEYFLTFQQIWQSPWGFGGFIEKDPMSLQFGQVILVISLLTLILNFFVKSKFRSLIFFLGGTFIIYTLLETKASLFIWDKITIIHYLQFPWRLHILTSLIGIILVGFFFYLLTNFINKKYSLVFILLVGFTSVFLSYKESFSFFQAKSFSDEPPVSETTTWNDEYMPNWVKSKPKKYAPDKIIFLGEKVSLENIEWGYNQKKFTITNGQIGQIRIAQVFYPGWEAYVDNKRVDIKYEDNEQGLMTVNIHEGKNEVSFYFRKTWWRNIADIISLLSLVGILTSGMYVLFRKVRFLNAK